MNYSYYLVLISEYINAGRSQERFCAEIGFPEDAPSVENFIAATKIIAAAADNNIKELVELSGLNLTNFSRKFQIPYRTLQNWVSGERKPPEYLPALIGYALVSELSHEAQKSKKTPAE